MCAVRSVMLYGSGSDFVREGGSADLERLVVLEQPLERILEQGPATQDHTSRLHGFVRMSVNCMGLARPSHFYSIGFVWEKRQRFVWEGRSDLSRR